MGASVHLARLELRRRWRLVVLLTVAVSVAGGTVLAAVAGADRAASSLDRFLASGPRADILVAGPDLDALGPVAGLTGVDDLSAGTVYAVSPVSAAEDDFFPMVAPADGKLGTSIDRPRVMHGRVPDPAAPHEVALGERTARRLGVSVGDRLAMQSWREEDMDDDRGPAAEPGGPAFDLTLVGIVRQPYDLITRDDDLAIDVLTPAFDERYRDEIGALGRLGFVDLSPQTTIEDFTAAMRDADLDVEIDPGFGARRVAGAIDPTLGVIANGLRIFAAVVAAAAAIALGQAVTRGARATVADDDLLRAVGASRRDIVPRRVAVGAAASVAGAVGSVAVAVALSPLFPIGIAGRAEPDPGVDVDGAVLATGAGALLLVGFALTAVGAAVVGRGGPMARPSSMARLARRTSSAPMALGLGLSTAGPGATTSAWSARVGVAIGVVGIVAAAVFAASLASLLDTPSLYGWGWDVTVASDDVAAVRSDPAVASAGVIIEQIELDVAGVTVFGVAVPDEVDAVVARGDQPVGDGEIALGKLLLDRTGLAVGDEVDIRAAQTGRSARFRIVGQAVYPVSGDGNTALAEGAALTTEGADRLGVDRCEGETACFSGVAVTWVDGADVDAAIGRLAGDEPWNLFVAEAPGEVRRLTEVERIPWVLTAFLAALAVVAVAHAVWAGVRRRRRDLGMARALGMTPRDIRWALVAHVTHLVVVASAIGLLVGVPVGQRVWTVVADGLGVRSDTVVPATLLLIPPAAWLVAQAAAAVPARMAASTRPALVLRAE